MRRVFVSFAIVLAVAASLLAQTPASKPTTTTSAPATTIESPEMLFDMQKPLVVPPEKRPNWDSLTGIQKEKLQKDYQVAIARSKSTDCRGQKVAWPLTIEDITPVKGGEAAYKVEAASASGYLVTCYLPAGAQEQLLNFQRGSQVLISGTIKDYAAGKAPPARGWFNFRVEQFGVLLVEAVVAKDQMPTFEGMEIDASEILFLIDKSGSMLETMDALRAKLLSAIDNLPEDRRFQVFFFSTGAPKELPPGKLLEPTDENKKKMKEFLKTIECTGSTDPLPALTRALTVLSAGAQGKTKAIVLLTDGRFPNNEKIEQLLRSRNPGKLIKVYTVLWGEKEKDAAAFLEKLAKEFGGKFKIVAEEN